MTDQSESRPSSRPKGVSFGAPSVETAASSVEVTLDPQQDSGIAAPQAEDDAGGTNPFSFTLPTFTDISQYQEKERMERAERMRLRGSLKLHERQSSRQRRVQIPRDEDAGVSISDLAAVQSPKSQELAISTRDRHIEKEHISDYIQKKRDMFLVQYALEVKRNEMEKLESITSSEESRIRDAESQLDADGKKFYEFLKENDRSSAEAVRTAEQQTRLKEEKTAEIKALDSEVQTLQSTLSKNEDRLKDLQTYIQFLDSLAPQEWLDKKRARSKNPNIFTSDVQDGGDGSTVAAGDSDNAPYFSTPQQLLKMFSELEGHNLSLITNGQEVEESLQDLQDRVAEEQHLMLQEQADAAAKNEELERQIEHESNLGWFARERASYFSSNSSEKQELEMAALERKVAAVYSESIGENEANISALQMLTNIENKLEELFEAIAKMPPEKVAEAEKAKEKQRRLRARQEKLEAQRRHQEERVRKALERAQAAPKAQTGKKLMYRSAPPKQRRTSTKRRAAASAEEVEHQYLFG